MNIKSKRAAVSTGSVVAFSKAADAIWYDVIRTEGEFAILVREAGTSYAAREADRSMIEQVKAA